MVKSLQDTYTLNNGVEIPCVGFGTWQTPDGETAKNSVKWAIEAGYRHIDTAWAYDNEESVGEGIKAGLESTGLKRENLFVTTKLLNTEHGWEKTLQAIDSSLGRLGLGYVDMYLVHWPNPIHFRDNFEKYNEETWNAMEEILRSGKARAIGVSNYLPHHLEATAKIATIPPVVNQICLYPGFEQADLVKYCREHGMLLEAYSPLGTGKVLNAPELKPIAEKHGVSVAQVCLRWSLQKGFLPLPKSTHQERIEQNGQLFDFALDDEDMRVMDSLKGYETTTADPDTSPF